MIFNPIFKEKYKSNEYTLDLDLILYVNLDRSERNLFIMLKMPENGIILEAETDEEFAQLEEIDKNIYTKLRRYKADLLNPPAQDYDQ